MIEIGEIDTIAAFMTITKKREHTFEFPISIQPSPIGLVIWMHFCSKCINVLIFIGHSRKRPKRHKISSNYNYQWLANMADINVCSLVKKWLMKFKTKIYYFRLIMLFSIIILKLSNSRNDFNIWSYILMAMPNQGGISFFYLYNLELIIYIHLTRKWNKRIKIWHQCNFNNIWYHSFDYIQLIFSGFAQIIFSRW